MDGGLNLSQRARVAVGLSQRRFAELIGVSRSVVERWERGRSAPTAAAESLLKLVEAHPGICLSTLQNGSGPQLDEPDES